MSQKVPDISFTNKLMPRKGRILLSDPFIGDEFFERSVVYLCEHSKEGSFGFVLNHYIDVNLNHLNPAFPIIDTVLSIGGPVENETMYFMHTFGEELNDSLEIADGIYIGGDFEQLYSFIKENHFKEHKIRFFLGYSGWSEGQLQDEIKENAWVVSKIDSAEEIMNSEDENLWKYFMNKLGPKYKLISEFPLDPNEN
jgi:putative transcriptional regulator